MLATCASMLCMAIAKWAMVLVEVEVAAIVGKCFDVFFGSLMVTAGVQRWERVPVDGSHTDSLDEGAAIICRCFGDGWYRPWLVWLWATAELLISKVGGHGLTAPS